MPIRWTQADMLSKQMDDAGTVWHSGHVNDVLPLSSGEVIVATDSGGVWSVPLGGTASPLTNWDAPDVQCLALGPDGENHVFASGGIGLSFTSPEVVSGTSGRLDVFAVAQDHALWHLSKVGGIWLPPELLGGDILGSPSVCSWDPIGSTCSWLGSTGRSTTNGGTAPSGFRQRGRMTHSVGSLSAHRAEFLGGPIGLISS